MNIEDNNFIIHGPKPVQPIPNYSFGKLIYDSLCENFDRQQAVLIDALSGQSKSYQKLLDDACELAEALRCYGCTTKTVVSISSENNLEFFVPVISTLFVGSILSPINIFYKPHELKHVLDITETSIVFVSKTVAEKYIKLKRELKFIDRIIVFDTNEKVAGTQNVKEFIAEQLGRRKVCSSDFKPWNGDSSNTAFVQFSSGTTGLPKGVMLTHKNYVVRVLQIRHPRQHLIQQGVISGVLPCFHGFGLTMGLTSIVTKNTTVLFKKFDEDLFLDAIQKYKINILTIPPPLAVFLAKTPKVDKYDLSSIKEIVCGAAPLSKNIEFALKERLKLRTIRQGYGLTEATLATMMMEINEDRSGSCGKVVPYIRIIIRDPETEKPLGPHKVGEICVKGPTVMKGYYNNKKATEESFTSDGWLRTGDLGYYDDDKYFYIVDRLKELIKYKGYQVAPAELESLLIHHPKVLDVGVVGVPDELAGELPVAFVVKKSPDVTEAELQEFVAEKVSSHKRLRGGVIFVSAIPKNASGKILRRELKLLLKNYKSRVDSKL